MKLPFDFPDNQIYIVVIVVIVAILVGIVFGLKFPFKNFNFSENKVNTTDNKPENTSPEKQNGEENVDGSVSLSVFKESGQWSSEGGWTAPGRPFYQAKVEDGSLKIKDGKTFGHLALKFRGSEFKEVKADVRISKPDLSNVELYVGTGGLDKKTEIAHVKVRGVNLKDKKMYKLEDGDNRVDLGDMNWGNLTYFKFRIDRSSTDVKSPEIKSIKIS